MLSERAARKTPSYADIIYPVFSFVGGVNTRSSQLFLSKADKFALKPDQLTICNNMIRTQSGGLIGRPGRVKLNASAVVPAAGDAVIRSIYELRRSDGTHRVCMNAGNTFYILSGSTWNATGSAFTTPNLRRSYCQFKEVLLGVDGTNDMLKFDGTTLSTIAAAPKGKVMASHRNRVWVLKDKSLHYCARGDETDWTSPNNAGVLPVPVTRGMGGTGLLSLWDRLIIWCQGQVFQLLGTGPNDFEISPINLSYGHEGSCYAVIAAGNDVYYANGQGVHALSISQAQSVTGDISYNYASAAIEPSWQEIGATNIPNVVAVEDKLHNLVLFLHSPNSANNDSAWVADYYHLDPYGQPTWTHYSAMPFASAQEVFSINSKSEILFGGYDGFVYRQTDDPTDDGAAIACQWQYVTDCDTPHFIKLMRHCLLFTSAISGILSINASFDFGKSILAKTVNVENPGGDRIGTTFTIGVSALANMAFKQTRVSLPGHGRFLVYNFSFSATKRLTFGGFILYGGLRRMLLGN